MWTGNFKSPGIIGLVGGFQFENNGTNIATNETFGQCAMYKLFQYYV
jgi:hypothetical protein